MSRRRKRAAPPAAERAKRAPGPRARPARGASPAIELAMLVAVFAVATGIAELAGAANLGVAIGVGQVAFVLALVLLLARR